MTKEELYEMLKKSQGSKGYFFSSNKRGSWILWRHCSLTKSGMATCAALAGSHPVTGNRIQI